MPVRKLKKTLLSAISIIQVAWKDTPCCISNAALKFTTKITMATNKELRRTVQVIVLARLLNLNAEHGSFLNCIVMIHTKQWHTIINKTIVLMCQTNFNVTCTVKMSTVSIMLTKRSG